LIILTANPIANTIVFLLSLLLSSCRQCHHCNISSAQNKCSPCGLIANDEKKMNIKQERREEALAEIRVTIESQKVEAICQKLEVQDDLDELDDLTELETKMFG
jgi:hypothetical protein